MSDVKDILEKVSKGEITPEEAETMLKLKPFTDLGFAKPDIHRGLRQGIPEVIYGEGRDRQSFIIRRPGDCHHHKT